jgi:ariadne-1
MARTNPLDDSRARIIILFRQLDTKGDGFIDKKDVCKIFAQLDKSWSDGLLEKVLNDALVGADGRISIEDFAEWVFTSGDRINNLLQGLESLEFQLLVQEDSQYLEIISSWAASRPDTVVRFIREDLDEGRIVLDLWGVELLIYLPKEGESTFFMTTSTEDQQIFKLLDELNGSDDLYSLPALLTRADEMFSEKILRTSTALLRSYSRESDAAESPVTAMDTTPAEAPAPLDLLREQSAVVLDLKRIAKVQEGLIEHFSKELGIEASAAALLMMHVNWDDDLLQERLEMGAGALKADAGVALQPGEEPAASPQLCTVCFADEAEPTLPCGHGLCKDCWPGFLKCNLDSGTVGGENCLKLRCPGERCPLIVPGSIFEQFLEPSDYQRYQQLWTLSFVNDNKATVWCPKAGCELCVGFSSRKATVACACGHVFCFSCSADAHEPATCAMAKAWTENLDKNLSKSERAEQHKRGVKPCPNPDCGVATYKDDGCHWLLCPKCKENWCWQCGHWGGGPSGRPPPHHVDICNDPVNEEWFAKAKESFDLSSAEALARFRWYYQRHVNHLGSLSFADKLRVSVEELSADMDSEDDKKLIVEAAEILIESRRMLAWSYVWAFSKAQEKKVTTSFEKLQNEIEMRTEQLSKMIEGDPPLCGLSWLWVALRTKKELTSLVAGGSDKAHDVQRNDLVDHLTALKQDLESMKGFLDCEQGDTAAPGSPRPNAVAPKAKAKGKAKAKPRAKAVLRPARQARR